MTDNGKCYKKGGKHDHADQESKYKEEKLRMKIKNAMKQESSMPHAVKRKIVSEIVHETVQS